MSSPSRALLAAAVAVGLAACSSSATTGSRDSANADVSPLALPSCTQIACTGAIDGTDYRIDLPQTWNGTLLLWSHGYRTAVAVPPSLDPVLRTPESAPDKATAEALLAKGYALAGSASATNGWAVLDGIKAAEDLHAFFLSRVATPRRTYVWGQSMGGLVTQLVSEKHPDWVTGAAPECGAVAGTTENLDGALAIAFMVKTLIDPGLQITGYASAEQAIAAFGRARDAVITAAKDVAGGGTAKVVAIAAIGHLATKTKTYDGHDAVSAISATAEEILTAMGYATFGQQEFATRVGGQGITIAAVDFGAGVTEADRSAVKNFGGDLDALLAALASGARPAVDPAARAKAIAQGETTGEVTHPTVTLHDEQDPLVIVQNERVLGDRFAAHRALGHLTQLFTKPPATYAAPAPYGAGHCNFTTTEQVGLVKVLDRWVLTGKRPAPADAVASFAAPTGLDPTYYPLPFPLQKH